MSQGTRRYRKVRYQKKSEEESQSRWSKGVRDGFDTNGDVVCKSCFHLKNEVNDLKEEVKRLKQKLNYRDKGAGDKLPLGPHTPSARIDNKSNTGEENRLKKGGAKVGHKGHGRAACRANDAEEVIDVAAPSTCSECLCALNSKDTRERTLIESVPVVAKKVVYRCKRGVCPRCFKVFPSKPPALAKSLYGNSLIAQAAVLHFVHGVPIGKLSGIFGENVTLGGLIESFHRLGRLSKSARDILIAEYRRASVKHADETGWRNDGRSGWAWLFSTPALSIFEFKDNRSSRVPADVFGKERLPGVLVVDRYGAYNKMPVPLQYCFAHLLREVGKLEDEFKESVDVQDFCSRLATLLSEAMKLRNLKISDEEYRSRAESIQEKIEAIVKEPQKHFGVQRLQDIFIDKRERLYHWVKAREIPAENNAAERELRPLVVARKVSFGSQSDAGAQTRSSIMTLLFTAKKRLKEKSLEEWLRESLNRVATDPSINLATLLPPPQSTPDN
jgi:hypothetical protein